MLNWMVGGGWWMVGWLVVGGWWLELANGHPLMRGSA
jgi:hypothetical protein